MDTKGSIHKTSEDIQKSSISGTMDTTVSGASGTGAYVGSLVGAPALGSSIGTIVGAPIAVAAGATHGAVKLIDTGVRKGYKGYKSIPSRAQITDAATAAGTYLKSGVAKIPIQIENARHKADQDYNTYKVNSVKLAEIGTTGLKLGQDITESASKKMSAIAKIMNIPVFYRLSILLLFFVFFYKIFYDIFIFFGFNSLEIIIYLTWFAILLLLVSFLNVNRSNLYTEN